jgi:peptidoglycan hydrolase-like protein with peptidoglycan-binding domain
MMIVSANEYGNFVEMYIYGIDFTDEAQTISVEDLFTENTFSFVARDVSTFKAGNIRAEEVHKQGTNIREEFSQRFYVLNSSSTDFTDLAKLERELSLSKINQLKNKHKYHTLSRTLYYSSSRIMTGNDVSNVQELLNRTKLVDIPINGVFDETTDKAVRIYQSHIKDDIDGVVDDKLYNALINETIDDGTRLGIVVNKYGAYVYREMSYESDIVDTKMYREQIVIHDFVVSEDNNEQSFHKWYKVNNGYIAEIDLYSSYYTGNVIEFPKVTYGNSNAYVTMVQSVLSYIYPEYTNISGLYDYDTQNQIKKLQSDNGLFPSGIVDYDTWLLLQSLSGNVSSQLSDDNFKIKMNTLPGTYHIPDIEIINTLDLFNVSISCDNYINVKFTTVSIYDNSTSEIYTKTLSIKEEQVISLKEFSNAFLYNPKYGKTPIQVDYIIYPYNKKSYKWSIIKEQGGV